MTREYFTVPLSEKIGKWSASKCFHVHICCKIEHLPGRLWTRQMMLNISKCQFYAVSQMSTSERIEQKNVRSQGLQWIVKMFLIINSLWESLNVSLLQFCGSTAEQFPNLHNLYNWQQLKYVSTYFPKYICSSTDYTHNCIQTLYSQSTQSPDKCQLSCLDFPNPKPLLIRLMGAVGGLYCQQWWKPNWKIGR